jgi:hypothetical protein
VSDRPSRHPAGKVVLPDIPRAPRAPRVGQGFDHGALAPRLLPALAVQASEEDQPSSGLPTVPPPATFNELQRMSARPSPAPVPPAKDDPKRHDSRSFTLPGPDAVPRLLVDPADQSWFDISEESRSLLSFVDGRRSISRIARDRGIAPREAQLRIADLRDRGIVELF